MEPFLHDIDSKSDYEVLTLSLEHPDCFATIVRRYEVPFLRKISAMLRDEEKAKDIVQDTFVKIYANARKFSPQEGASFKSWAYKILINTCFTYCKKMKREKEALAFVDDEMLALAGDDGAPWEEKLDLDHFLSIASKIPALLSRVLMLTVLEGKTDEDIAAIEGVTASTIRVRLHRAKKEFKRVDTTFHT